MGKNTVNCNGVCSRLVCRYVRAIPVFIALTQGTCREELKRKSRVKEWSYHNNVIIFRPGPITNCLYTILVARNNTLMGVPLSDTLQCKHTSMRYVYFIFCFTVNIFKVHCDSSLQVTRQIKLAMHCAMLKSIPNLEISILN